MFNHVGVVVADFERSRRFYRRCLLPLGFEEIESGQGDDGVGWAVFGTEADRPFLWIGNAKPAFWAADDHAGAAPVHLAFSAPDRSAIHDFHRAALANGGRDNGPPGTREGWTPFYSAFVIDPDGNNVEATCRE